MYMFSIKQNVIFISQNKIHIKHVIVYLYKNGAMIAPSKTKVMS